MIATHLGIVDEEQIENMSYLFFEQVLLELGKKLNYDAVVNYGGNSFCKDSWKMIMDANPLAGETASGDNVAKGIAALFAKSPVTVIRSDGEGSKGHGNIEDIVGSGGS